MEDLSLHILDIVENATTAGATRVEIRIIEDTKRDLLQMTIKDNGHGMDSQTLKQVTDPFVTSRTTRRVGLGIPLFEQAAREAGGRLCVASEVGLGTEITATFRAGHIDRKPMGDMGATLVSLIAGNPDVDFVYEYERDKKRTSLDTRAIKDEIEGLTTISDPKILQVIREMVNDPTT